MFYIDIIFIAIESKKLYYNNMFYIFNSLFINIYLGLTVVFLSHLSGSTINNLAFLSQSIEFKNSGDCITLR